MAETEIAKDVCFCCKTAVAVAAHGRAHAARRHIYPTNLRDIAVASSVDGRAFLSPVRVSEDGWQIHACPEDGPSLAVAASGNLFVAWPTVVAGNRKALFFSVSTDGGKTFAPRSRIDDGVTTPAHPQLAVFGDHVIVAWDQNAGDERHVWMRRLSDDALGRTPPVRVDDGTRALYPSVTVTPQGTIMAWVASAGERSEIRLRRMAVVIASRRSLERVSAAWLVTGRWLSVAAAVATALIALGSPDVSPATLQAVVVVATIAGSNILLWSRSRSARPISVTSAGLLVCGDVLLLSWLLSVSGGPLNAMAVFGLVEIVLAALVLGRVWA